MPAICNGKGKREFLIPEFPFFALFGKVRGRWLALSHSFGSLLAISLQQVGIAFFFAPFMVNNLPEKAYLNSPPPKHRHLSSTQKNFSFPNNHCLPNAEKCKTQQTFSSFSFLGLMNVDKKDLVIAELVLQKSNPEQNLLNHSNRRLS